MLQCSNLSPALALLIRPASIQLADGGDVHAKDFGYN
jgi:hypothetical protein